MNKYNSGPYIFAVCAVLTFNACVPKRHLTEAENTISHLRNQNRELSDDIGSLKNRLQLMEEANTSVSSELSEKEKSLIEKNKMLEERNRKISELQDILEKQKENTERLRQKLASALGNFNSEDLSVFIKDGKVYVSMSDKLLFASGSADLNQEGISALEHIANALKDNPDIHINVEGHTDTVPIKIKYPDNWALSVNRSVSIVRILTQKYNVDPIRITASGRSEYDPVADNATPEGRSKNRRTEIILAPKLDEVYNLLSE